ncbi:MAG TPA: ATP-binding protein, partial [Bryobacteraceae bacterium]|nr:ATP-binding protein [Bryobacteraceae bacterium]
MLTLVERQASLSIREIPAVITDRTGLTPVQRLAVEQVIAGVRNAGAAVLKAAPGAGRTTVLCAVRAETGGVLLGARDFMSVLAAHHPAGLEEAFVSLLEGALDRHDLAILDDFHLINAVATACDYPRTCLLAVALTAVLDRARARRRQLLIAMDDGDVPAQLESRAFSVEIGAFTPADYESICRAYLPAATADKLDYTEIHRFAPELTAHQLKNTCAWLASDRAVDTAGFTEYLAAHNIVSNVELKEVAPVAWKDLKGFDDVIQTLEAKIALPFENRALAAELQLKPKRGVLLAGPPGTGKTTIGRALAARLKGKFFLIDGTVIEGTYNFFCRIKRVFDAAKRSAPSVVFIDDCDLLFENSHGSGFQRYLLTMLDGLESASAERVCVMITATDVHSLPPALLRSGRIELWLETRLPDAAARAAILSDRLSRLPPPLSGVAIDALAEASGGLTGADLRAAVEDGKLLFAHDRTAGKEVRPAQEYFLEAIETVRSNQRNYA